MPRVRGDADCVLPTRDPRCILLVLEAVPPFRGIEARGLPGLVESDVSDVRENNAGRYVGADGGRRFAAARVSKPGVLLRLSAAETRMWDLEAILPPTS